MSITQIFNLVQLSTFNLGSEKTPVQLNIFLKFHFFSINHKKKDLQLKNFQHIKAF